MSRVQEESRARWRDSSGSSAGRDSAVRPGLPLTPLSPPERSRLDGGVLLQDPGGVMGADKSWEEMSSEERQAVRLLGVRSIARRRQQAEEHLRELAGGKKVYLRFDDACPPRDDDALVYLYLRNRTPVNRHLIRSGLVEVDTTRDYRFKKAFLAERGR